MRNRSSWRGLDKNHFSHIVIDECHRSAISIKIGASPTARTQKPALPSKARPSPVARIMSRTCAAPHPRTSSPRPEVSKAVNPHAKTEEDTRTPAELIELIKRKGREVQEILGKLAAL